MCVVCEINDRLLSAEPASRLSAVRSFVLALQQLLESGDRQSGTALCICLARLAGWLVVSRCSIDLVMLAAVLYACLPL